MQTCLFSINKYIFPDMEDMAVEVGTLKCSINMNNFLMKTEIHF